LKTSRLSNRLNGKAFWEKSFQEFGLRVSARLIQTSAEAQVPAEAFFAISKAQSMMPAVSCLVARRQ
jgi:hypothetical protein